MGFCVYVPLPPLRGQHTVLCHPRWLPTSGLTEFAMCWGGAGFFVYELFKTNFETASVKMLSNSSCFTEIRPVTKELMTAATFSVKNPKTPGVDNFKRFCLTVPSGNSFIWQLATFRNSFMTALAAFVIL